MDTGIHGYHVHNEGEQKMPPENITLWHKDYFKLIIFKEQQTPGKKL